MGARSSAATLLVFLATASPAAALEPGVFVAPGNPAAKEYSIPLSTLRGQAIGHTPSPGQAEPPFGVGITATALSSGPRALSGGSSRGRNVARRASVWTRRPRPTSERSTAASGPSQGTVAGLIHPRSSAPEIALIAVAVLVGGLAAGASLATVRRRRG